MADEPATPTEQAPPTEHSQITFSVKSSSDQKYVVTVSEAMTVLELKNKLSTDEYANVSADRQRLIYSGRVMKDPDALSTYKIKDGNTVHMVKSAASSQRPPSSTAATSSAAGGQDPSAATGVPPNLASGTGSDPLAGLTGARYAGFAQMPGAGMFGPDGGMGAPQGPEDMLRMLENPQVQQQMNEVLNNPQMIQMLQNSPGIRDQPFMREMLNNPEMRRLIMDPQFIRTSMQMNRMMGGGMGQQPSMPAPGVTDTTPQGAETGTEATNEQAGTTPQAATSQFPGLFPFGGQQQQQQQGQANPFAALFGGGLNQPQTGNATTENNSSQGSDQQNTTTPPPNMFNMFGNAQGPGAQGGEQQNNPIAAAAQQLMQDPQMMRMAMQMMGGGAAPFGASPGAVPPSQGAGGANPFAALFGGGFPGAQPQAPAPVQDTRPPEEQYAEQLRSLNEMGFYEFDRNVRALRMAGGSVQGAVEVLLSGSI